MDLPPELLVIHQPVRLKIMGLLYQHRDVSFTRLRDALSLTPGNLGSHAARLQEAGYVDARRVLTSNGFEARYHITRSGVQAFRAYLEALRRFLEAALEPDDAPVGASR